MRQRTWVDRGLTAVLAATAMGFLVVVVGSVTGMRFVVIESGSMTPTLRTADIIVTRSQPATDIHSGQIVTFRHPLLHQLVTHRVIAVRTEVGWIDVTTKGDANTVGETWRVPVAASVGRMVVKVPGGFLLVRLLRDRLLWVLLTVLGCAAVGFALLRWIWRAPVRT